MAAQLFVASAEARQVVKSKNLSAHVSEAFQCSEQIFLTIMAPKSSYFTGNSAEVQRLVGSARSILGFECNNIKKIKIIGQVNGKTVYQGRSFASEKWMVVNTGTKSVQPQAESAQSPSTPTAQKSPSGWGQKLIVKGAKDFRDIKLITWNGLPRLGVADRRGLPRKALGANRELFKKNASLIDVARSLRQHHYSFGLLTTLDYMRTHKDCFSNLEAYEAKTTECMGMVINHADQVKPWYYNIYAMALALKPQAYGKFFCPGKDGKPLCQVVRPDNITKKGKPGQRRYDEFEKRDWFAGLMSAYGKDFKKMWQSSHLPNEIWHVRPVLLSEYDFDKQQYSFSFSPGGITFFDNSVPPPPDSQEETGQFYIGHAGIVPIYIPTADFETQNSGYLSAVSLPMKPKQAREVGNINKRREFYAVVKLKLLPYKEMGQHGPVKGQTELRFHLAENRVQLYQDLALTKKITEVPVYPNVKTLAESSQRDSTGEQITAEVQNAAGGQNTKAKTLPEGYQLLDDKVLAIMRIKQGTLLESRMQLLADSIARDERSFWLDHRQRLQNSNHSSHLQDSEQKRLKDLARLGHINWQQMKEGQRKVLFDYMLGQGAEVGKWPNSFPSVNWGLNLATIFPKGHLSSDPVLLNVPATDQEKKVVQQFLNDLAKDYDTEKLILSYTLGKVQYDNQKKSLKYNWPFRLLTRVDFDDNPNIANIGSYTNLVSAKAKDSAIYSVHPFPQDDRDRYPSRCITNPKTKANNCATHISSILDGNLRKSFYALDRVLIAPELKMAPERAARLINNPYQKKEWKLFVELEKARMETSSFSYKKRGKTDLQQGESQTIFASVKKAIILTPDGEVIWSTTRDQLKMPVKGSKLTSGEFMPYEWQKAISLADHTANSAIFDFLFVKYYPERVDQRFLEAMFSSRWWYEKNQKNPVGGRFFNQDARQPTWHDLQNSLSGFHKWMIQRANALPARVNVQVPVRYVSNDRVDTYSNTIDWSRAPGSPFRSASSAKRQAEKRVKKCRSQEAKDQSAYETCQDLRKDLTEARDNLAKAEKAGCQEFEEQKTNDNPDISSIEACDFSKVPMGELQNAVMACLIERCGPMPTTQDGAAEYQECSQKIIQSMSAQMASANGKSGSKRNQSKEPVSECEQHTQAVSQIEDKLKKNRCDDYSTPPEPRDCEELGKEEKVTHFYVDRLRFKVPGHSPVLLPNSTSYTDTNLFLEVKIDKLEVPYDPPEGSGTPSTAVIDLYFEINSAKSTNQKKVMNLEAVVEDSKVRAVASN